MTNKRNFNSPVFWSDSKRLKTTKEFFFLRHNLHLSAHGLDPSGKTTDNLFPKWVMTCEVWNMGVLL